MHYSYVTAAKLRIAIHGMRVNYSAVHVPGKSVVNGELQQQGCKDGEEPACLWRLITPPFKA